MKKSKYIIWDWNGTLLDDVDISITVMNAILSERGLPLIESRSAYQELFCFPVIDYYRKVGLDFEKEPFEALAKVFIENFQRDVMKSLLFPDALNILEHFKSSSAVQIILSASKTDNLIEQVAGFPIGHFFNHICGLDNFYAKSKIDVGKRFVEQNNLSGEDLLIVGDTCHDYELALELNCRCVLVANGHQSKNLLSACKCEIIDNLSELCLC